MDPADQKIVQRLNRLEESMAYLQSDFESLNAAVLENSQRLEKLTQLLDRLSLRLDATASEETPRDLEDERPPHY